ncbi:MAG: hypothetical protein R6V40_02280 [Candidatus Moraniibacteriota bacterium]
MFKHSKIKKTENSGSGFAGLKKDGLYLLAALFLFVFVFSSCFYSHGYLALADEEDENREDQLEKENEENEENLKELEEKAEELREEINETEGEKKEKENQLRQINLRIYNLKIEIQKIQEEIDEYEEEINDKKKSIKKLEQSIEFSRSVLSEYLRHFRKGASEVGLVSLNSQKNLGDYFRTIESYENLQKKISETLDKIRRDKFEIEDNKKKIEEKKEKKERVYSAQEQQKSILKQQESQKKIAVEEKQEEISEKRDSLSEVRKEIGKIKRKLNVFLDDDFSIEDLVEAVKDAEDETGARKEFIFAMLDKETDLGRFTGGCYYDEVKDNMKNKDRDEFKDIMDDLGYDKDEKKLSCWPGFGYGGAMGIAQFMPTTWAGYKDKISEMTGNDPANPWRLEDGVMGMAIKLKEAGADDEDDEHYAAKLYYCGGPDSPYWSNKCEAYADTVISWSEGYDDYFE